jgi:hypothetical protein
MCTPVELSLRSLWYKQGITAEMQQDRCAGISDYSSHVVLRNSMHILLMVVAALNGFFDSPPTREIWMITGPEFESEEGKTRPPR